MLPSTSNNLVASVMARRLVSVALARPKDAPAAAATPYTTTNTTTRIEEIGERLQCFLLKLFLLLPSLSLLLFLFIRVPIRKMIGKRNMTNTEVQVCHYGTSDSSYWSRVVQQYTYDTLAAYTHLHLWWLWHAG